jgi:predicted negative regulator of RcsB-dependent stress response
VPESSNIEIAHRLTEHRDAESAKKSWQDLVVEILEAVLLGVVAVATAWSAYHAAKWDGREAELYAQASTLRIEANELDTLGGQQRLLDVSTFNTYTGTTVVLATVLFLVALSPRFRSRRVRFALLLLTGGLAVYALATILTFPRL